MNTNLDPDAQAADDDVQHAVVTLQQHAMQEIDAVAAGIADLQKKYSEAVFDVATTKGMADAKAARMEIREVRYSVERIRKEKGAELKKIATAINERAADITDPIRALEDPIDAQIKAEEDRKEAERAERQRQEQERIAGMNARLDNIRNAPLHAVGATADEIQQAIGKLDEDALDGFDEVYLPTAQQTKEAALATLNKLLDERRALDAQAMELEQQRAEQAAREAEAAEQRRIQREQDEAERRELAEQRRQLQEREDAQRAAEAQAEQERVVAAQKAEADRLAREQAEAEEREQARREAEEAAIKAATIRDAAEEVLALLDEKGLSGHIAARKLIAALAREVQS